MNDTTEFSDLLHHKIHKGWFSGMVALIHCSFALLIVPSKNVLGL